MVFLWEDICVLRTFNSKKLELSNKLIWIWKGLLFLYTLLGHGQVSRFLGISFGRTSEVVLQNSYQLKLCKVSFPP